MGWASGSGLMSDIIYSLVLSVPDRDTRIDIYSSIIPAFEKYECDTLYECEGIDEAFDAVLYVDTFINELMHTLGCSEEEAASYAEEAYELSENKDPTEDAYEYARKFQL